MENFNKSNGWQEKTSVDLQAQIEDFAERQITPPFSEEEELFQNNVGIDIDHLNIDFDNPPDNLEDKISLFKEEQSLFYKYSGILSNIKDLNNLPDDIPSEVKNLLLKYKDDYVDFLKIESYKKRKFKAECIERYEEEFKSLAIDIKSKIEKGMNPKDIEGFIDHGTEAHVFKINTSSGEYALKIYTMASMPTIDLEAMRRAIDVKGVSHLKAYSHDENIMVMDYIKGKSLFSTSTEECPPFSNEELKNLLTTIFSLYEKGIIIDENPKNFIYNNENKSITVIDYYLNSSNRELIHSLRNLSNRLSFRSESPIIATKSNMSEYNNFLDRIKEIEPRIIKIIEDNFPDFYAENKEYIKKNWK